MKMYYLLHSPQLQIVINPTAGCSHVANFLKKWLYFMWFVPYFCWDCT